MQKKSFLFPDVETYTKFAIFTMGKSSRTTGYWSHGLQYAVMKLVPEFIRTNIAMQMNKKFRQEYFNQHLWHSERPHLVVDVWLCKMILKLSLIADEIDLGLPRNEFRKFKIWVHLYYATRKKLL